MPCYRTLGFLNTDTGFLELTSPHFDLLISCRAFVPDC